MLRAETATVNTSLRAHRSGKALDAEAGPVLLHLEWAVPATRIDTWRSWYDEEHLPEVLGVPGMRSGRRFSREEMSFTDPVDENCLVVYMAADEDALMGPDFAALSVGVTRRTIDATRGLAFERKVYRQIWPSDTPRLTPAGAAILHILTGADASVEREFASWYDEEHAPAIAAVPGVVDARRFIRIDREGDPYPYLAIYELASVDVLDTAEFRAASARTPRRDALGDAVRARAQVYSQQYVLDRRSALSPDREDPRQVEK